MFQAVVFWRRLKLFLILIASILILTGSFAVTFASVSRPIFSEPAVMSNYELNTFLENKAVAQVESQIVVNLPKATTSPIPAPTYVLSKPLGSHQLFGFAPYWTLASEQSYPIQDYTTISYFSIGVNADGTLNESGSDWSGYNSQALVNLIDTAHKDGVRVVLTLSCLQQSTLESLTSSGPAPSTLANEVIPLLKAKSLDGVNFDFEGQGSGIRAGLTRLITTTSTLLRQADPNWQVTADTYVSSAGDPSGPFDIAALNPAVDGFFIMGYDMENQNEPSPNSALSNWNPSDVQALQEYSQVVPEGKLILGIPLYGYEWPTNNGTFNATATGPPTAIPYSQIITTGSATYWDSQANVPWTSFQKNGQWYEIYFDDPPSIAMKVALAQVYHIAGVGVWALGMDNDNPEILSALLGGSSPVKNYAVNAPISTTASDTSTVGSSNSNPCGSSTSTPVKGTSSTSTTSSVTSSTSATTTTTSSSTSTTTTAGSTIAPSSSVASTTTSTIQCQDSTTLSKSTTTSSTIVQSGSTTSASAG